jgi:hypothetical protein
MQRRISVETPRTESDTYFTMHMRSEEGSGDHPDPGRRQDTHRRCEPLRRSCGREVGKFHSQKNRRKVEWAIAIFIDSRTYEEDYLEYEF